MKGADPDPHPRRSPGPLAGVLRDLRARGLLLPIALGAAVAAILIQGALAREPAGGSAIAAPPPQETALPQPVAPPAVNPDLLETLRPGLEKTPLSYLEDYWLQLGAITRPKLVRIGAEGLPGIVVLRGLVVAPIRAAEPILAERRRRLVEQQEAADTPSIPAAPGAPPAADPLVGVDRDMGLALFRADATEAATAFSAAEIDELAPGSLLASVSLAATGGLRVVPGYLASTRRDAAGPRGDLDVVFPPSRGEPLAALVDLDGALVGVSVEGGDAEQRWSYERVARSVARLVSDPACQSLEVSNLPAAAAERLDVAAGVVVERVEEAAFSPAPSIRPGDVLLEWDGEPVNEPQQFAFLYRHTPPGSRVRFRVLRGRRAIAGVTLMPGFDCRPVGSRPPDVEWLGVELEWGRPERLAGTETPGWRVLRVEPGSPAERAGLAEGDWILAVDGRPLAERSLAALRREPPEGGEMLLTLRRDERVRLVLAGPSPE